MAASLVQPNNGVCLQPSHPISDPASFLADILWFFSLICLFTLEYFKS